MRALLDPGPALDNIRVTTAKGETVTVKRSHDGAHVFLQVETDADNSVVAIPAGVMPWLLWALGRAAR